MNENYSKIEEEALKEYSENYYIVISSNGFVHIGKPIKTVSSVTGKEIIRVFECYNIRIWGTSNGLSELAIKGKQPNTELDYKGITDIPMDKLIELQHIKKTALESYGFIR